MDLSTKEIVQLIIQGGTAIVVFIIWLITFKQINETLKEAFSKHFSLSESLMTLLKDDQEYKLHVAGILDRLSIKLETPAQCPMLMGGRKIKLEVTE